MSSLKTQIKKYIIDSIEDEDEVLSDDATTKEKLQLVADMFTKVAFHPYNIKKFGNKQKIVSDYLQRIPSHINIDFENYKILEVGKSWGFNLDTKRKKDYFLANWWNRIAQNIFELFRTHNINI